MAGSSPKRVSKIHDFLGFAYNVSCATIGNQKSGLVYTGGEDRTVHVWNLEEEEPLQTLVGHTNPLECLTLGGKDEGLLVSGTTTGAIKLWNLDEAKLERSMSGHRSNCVTLDFHPFGDFFVSGSTDMSIKVWDTRRKDCIHTFKGHTRTVNCVRFSPDGRWVVSAGGDALVKLWDLTAGKLVKDFNLHRDSVNTLDFHPQEFLMATGSSDRTTKFWDLETLEHVGSAGPEASVVQKVAFTPDGKSLLSATDESVKVWAWEPLRLVETVAVKWGTLGDIAVQGDLLLACSVNHPRAGAWALDLSKGSLDNSDFAKKGSNRPRSPSTARGFSFESSRSPSKSPTSSSHLLHGESKLSSSTGKLTCTRAEALHHSGNCEMSESGKSEKLLRNVPAIASLGTVWSPILVRANFSTTTVSSCQKLAQPKVATATSMDQHSSPSALSNARRRSSVGHDLFTSSQASLASLLDTQQSLGNVAQKKRGTPTNHRASSGLPAYVREEAVVPAAYVMPADLPVSPVSGDRPRSSPASCSILFPSADHSIDSFKGGRDFQMSRILPPRSLGLSPPLSPSKKKAGETLHSSEANAAQRSESIDRVHSGTFAATASDNLDQMREEEIVDDISCSAGKNNEIVRAAESADQGPATNESISLGAVSSSVAVSAKLASESSEVVTPAKLLDEVNAAARSFSTVRINRHREGVSEIVPMPSIVTSSENISQVGRDEDPQLLSTPSQASIPARNSGVVLEGASGGRQGNAPIPMSSSSQYSEASLPAMMAAHGRENTTIGALPLGTAPGKPRRSTPSHIQGGRKPLALDMAELLPHAPEMETNDDVRRDVNDEEVIKELMEEHQAMNIILQTRLENLRRGKAFWVKDNARGLLAMMGKTDDRSVLVDVLSAISRHTGVFTLESCLVLMPLLSELLSSPHDRYISTGLSVLSQLLQDFGDLIRTSRASGPTRGVDIEAEQRRSRCTACYTGFHSLSEILSGIIRKALGPAAEEATRCLHAIQKL